jgi:hypothetical protein
MSAPHTAANVMPPKYQASRRRSGLIECTFAELTAVQQRFTSTMPRFASADPNNVPNGQRATVEKESANCEP